MVLLRWFRAAWTCLCQAAGTWLSPELIFVITLALGATGVWLLTYLTIGLRVSYEDEDDGIDLGPAPKL